MYIKVLLEKSKLKKVGYVLKKGKLWILAINICHFKFLTNYIAGTC